MTELGARIDDAQTRWRALAYPIAVVKRFSEHDGGRISAAIAFYGFFSLFPLILVFVSVLDLVLSDRSDLRAELIDSAIGQLPLVGQQIQAPSGASGSALTIAVGLATALWAGLGVINSLVGALATVWDIPRSSRPNFLMSRLRALVGLVVLAGVVVGSTVLGNLAALVGGGAVINVATLAGNAVINVVALLFVFVMLTPDEFGWRAHRPGAIGGGLVLFALQLAGSAIARRYVAGASDTYGTIAVVLGLLAWLHLVSRTFVLSAELNGVVERDLLPRAVGERTFDADRRAHGLDVRRVHRPDPIPERM